MAYPCQGQSETRKSVNPSLLWLSLGVIAVALDLILPSNIDQEMRKDLEAKALTLRSAPIGLILFVFGLLAALGPIGIAIVIGARMRKGS